MSKTGANSWVFTGSWATDGTTQATSVSPEYRAYMEEHATVTYENGVKYVKYLPAPVSISREAWRHGTIKPVKNSTD